MTDLHEDAAKFRQQMATDIRANTDDRDNLVQMLATEYALGYKNRIPALEEIDSLLREEGTADVIDAVMVLDGILVDHPAYTIVLRLRKTHVNLPKDSVIAEAIKAECDDLRNQPLPRLTLTVEGNGMKSPDQMADITDNVGWIVQNVNKRLRQRRLTQTEALLPERVTYVWQLCQMMGITPFGTTGQKRPV